MGGYGPLIERLLRGHYLLILLVNALSTLSILPRNILTSHLFIRQYYQTMNTQFLHNLMISKLGFIGIIVSLYYIVVVLLLQKRFLHVHIWKCLITSKNDMSG